MRFDKSIATKIACVAGICLVGASHAWAGSVLTFEGLQNFEQVDNYYNGGTGSLGSGRRDVYRPGIHPQPRILRLEGDCHR
jgi:hypothetical protein